MQQDHGHDGYSLLFFPYLLGKFCLHKPSPTWNSFYCVAIATDVVDVGSRTDSRDTFLCLSKEKYPKEKTPECRLSPVLLAFERGCRKGLLPLRQRDASMHRPFGLIRSKAPVLDAAYGMKTRPETKA
ncbi:hypothetical protein [Methylomonas sp. YC3]